MPNQRDRPDYWFRYMLQRILGRAQDAPTTPPLPPPPNHPPASSMPTNVWTLKNTQEYGIPVNNGSFAAIGGHGQTNAILCEKAEIDFITAVCPDNAALWPSWSTHPRGTIYLQTDNPQAAWWPVILISSREPVYQRQLVHVLDMVPNGRKVMGDSQPAVLLEGIKHGSDYSQYTPSTHPWLFAWCWTRYRSGGYGPSHTTQDGVARTFIMPLFDPASGFTKKTGTYAFWVPQSVLYQQIS